MALINKEYEKEHKEALGEDAKISDMGWPDMGNNKYADLLPYKDWVAINNAQRSHEIGYQNLIILIPNAFISSIIFPRWTCGLMAGYLFMRVSNMNGYSSFRGYNGAQIQQEFMQLALFSFICSAVVSSFVITGAAGPFIRFRGRIV
jgi:hypothetical protein